MSSIRFVAAILIVGSLVPVFMGNIRVFAVVNMICNLLALYSYLEGR